MAGMPDPAGSAAPETAVVAAATALAQGDHRVCAHRLAHAERHLAALPDDRAVPARLAAVLVRVVAALPCPDGAFHGLVRELDLLLEALPRGRTDGRPELRALVRHGYALMDLRAGRPRQAAAGLRLALPAAEAGADLQLRRCVGDLALAEALQGRFGRAADLVARAERLPEVPADPGGCPVPAVHLAGAWVAFEDVRLDDARAELGKVRQAAGRPPDGLISVLRALLTARLDLASGRPGQALAVLYSAQEEAAGMPWLRRLLLLVAAEAQAATGAVGAAMESARAAGGAAGAITLARIQLGLGEAAAAARTVRPAVVESTAVPADVRVEAWLLDACLAYRAGDGSKGRRSLEHALRLGERERISLPFAQARNWLFPVLRGDPALLGAHRALIGPLGAAAGAGTRPDADPGGSGGSGEAPMAFGRLSARELQVLGLLSEMLTTEEIATEMCVSVNTVKTHLRSIYRKLAVTRRGEAVRRAHHLDLL
ncbi:helix-turn-helix transcriptional regulator [Actinomadura graeca]|uniref:Helix-turn-helix transcriptional regulator n=2 Tax=Actinomadura graeca TaxID=2750812 RepID=A0ABX8R688_9ACTN|nr:helix-turn-helix transcriptional regulator [Actinomadura graeca]